MKLHSNAYVHRENLAWLAKIIGAAAAIQAADAHIKAAELAKFFRAQPDISMHPANGLRHTPDEMVNVIAGVFGPAGAGASPFSEKDFAALLEMDPSPWLLATGNGGVTAEFPFYSDTPAIISEKRGTALFQVSGDERHPQLGAGALLRLTLPVSLAVDSDLPHELNRIEASEWGSKTHLLGAWCLGVGSEKLLTYVSFLPALVHLPSVLENMAWAIGVRAKWARVHLDSLGIKEEEY